MPPYECKFIDYQDIQRFKNLYPDYKNYFNLLVRDEFIDFFTQEPIKARGEKLSWGPYDYCKELKKFYRLRCDLSSYWYQNEMITGVPHPLNNEGIIKILNDIRIKYYKPDTSSIVIINDHDNYKNYDEYQLFVVLACIFHAEHYCDGYLIAQAENGTIGKLLTELKKRLNQREKNESNS